MAQPLLESVMLLTTKEKDKTLLSDVFPDIAYCEEHQKLVESHLRAISQSKIDMPDPMESCSMCPKPEYVEINILASLQQVPQSLEASRTAWVNVLGTSKVVVLTEKDLVKKSILERELWFKYMAAAYSAGLKRSLQMKTSNQTEDKKAFVNTYDDELMQFYTHCQLRGTNGRSKKDVVCQQFCVEHDALGDFVPYRPMLMYKSCMICEKPKRPRKQQASVQRLDERQMFSGVNR